jgi:pyruvate kinase
VIVATEMLHTMTVASTPTKAEITDIANAVFDGCSATMLSGETAVGDFSTESVEVMAGVIDSAEKYIRNKRINNEICSAENRANAVALSVESFSINTFFDVIVLLGASERDAQMIAERRLSQPLIVATDDIFVSRCVNLLSGTIGFYLKDLYEPSSMLSRDKIFKILIERGLLRDDARILLIENPANRNEVGCDFNVSISLVKLD